MHVRGFHIITAYSKDGLGSKFIYIFTYLNINKAYILYINIYNENNENENCNLGLTDK